MKPKPSERIAEMYNKTDGEFTMRMASEIATIMDDLHARLSALEGDKGNKS